MEGVFLGDEKIGRLLIARLEESVEDIEGVFLGDG